jgi:hypothetical protein
MAEANTLAYYDTATITAVKSFIVQAPGVNAIKLVSFVADKEAKLARVFVLAITFQSSLTFADNTRSLPEKEASERPSNWVGSGLALKF